MRERVYLWYVLWVAAFDRQLPASIGGLAFQYLWPEAAGGTTGRSWSSALAVTSASFFMVDFLALARRGGWMLRLPQAAAWLCLLALLSAFVLPYPMAIRLASAARWWRCSARCWCRAARRDLCAGTSSRWPGGSWCWRRLRNG